MKKAIVVGGGIGGLFSAIVLSRTGWKVTLLERSPEIRETGAGIYIKENSISVMEGLGIFADLAPEGAHLAGAKVKDWSGAVLQVRPASPSNRVYVFERESLIRHLHKHAVEYGTDVILNEEVTSIDAEGIRKSDGRLLSADLIVGADGVNSVARRYVDPASTASMLPTVINRYLFPHRKFAHPTETHEYWSGRKRIGITPCGKEGTYVYQVAPADEIDACTVPNSVPVWSESFPLLRAFFEEAATYNPTQYRYPIVRSTRWWRGNIVLIGDSAHGIPPTLGQGAGLTIMNSYALAYHLNREPDMSKALADWQQKLWPIANMTQNWALRYDLFSRRWPSKLGFAKKPIMYAINRLPSFNRRMRIADRGLSVVGIKPGPEF